MKTSRSPAFRAAGALLSISFGLPAGVLAQGSAPLGLEGPPEAAREVALQAASEGGEEEWKSGPDGAPVADTSRVRGGRWVGLPFLFYAPETGVGGGALAGHYVRLAPDVEPSSFPASVTVTGRGQFVVEFFPDIYLRGGARASGELRFSHYPDVFYGVGPDTPEALEEDYTSRVGEGWVRVQRPVGPGLLAGIQVRIRQENMVSVEESGMLDGGTLLGADGGTTVGVGAVGGWDSRDNIFSPRRGRYVEASWLFQDGLLGSDFDFHHLVLDGRQFLPVGSASVLGFQAYLEAASGDVPFSLLPPLGGAQRMRGYRRGRFRDRVLVAGQGEFRFPVWWRFGGAAFVAVGDVAPHLGDLDLASLEFAGGAGLRFRFTEDGVTLRGDYALGREGANLYFTIGQAF